MVTLRNVIDVRTNKFHSFARVKEKDVKYFLPADEEEISEEGGEEE